MKKLLLLLIIFQGVFFITIQAQNNDVIKKKFHKDNIVQDTSAGYANAVKVDNIIYISGTVARDVTPEGIKKVYEILEKSLNNY